MTTSKKQIKPILLAAIAFIALIVFILCSERKPVKISPTTTKPTPTSVTPEVSVPSPESTTVIPETPIPGAAESESTPLPSEEDERAKIENMNGAETNTVEPELQEQINNGPTELPEDLKAQLQQGEIPLPEDLQRQLENDNQEIPEDIQKDLEATPAEEAIPEDN